MAKDGPEAQLQHVLAAWRKQPAEELRVLILETSASATAPLFAESPRLDRAAWDKLEKSKRALDLPRLLASFQGERPPELLRRFERVAKWPDDPRVVDAIFRWLDTPPCARVSPEAKAFWEAVLDYLIASADRSIRQRPFLTDFPGSDIRAHMMRAMEKQLPRLAPVKLSAAGRAAMKPVAPTPAPKSPSNVSERDLLAAIHAAPDDDAPRLIYADWLTERGDPWGEAIVLQITDGKKAKTRIDELIAKHAQARFASLPIEWKKRQYGNIRAAKIERGFPFEVELAPSVRQSPARGDPHWGTIEVIHCGLFSQAAPFAFDPAKASLRAIFDLGPKHALDVARRRPPRLRELGFHPPRPLGPFLDELQAAGVETWLEALCMQCELDVDEVNSRVFFAHPLIARLPRAIYEARRWSPGGVWRVMRDRDGAVSSEIIRKPVDYGLEWLAQTVAIASK